MKDLASAKLRYKKLYSILYKIRQKLYSIGLGYR